MKCSTHPEAEAIGTCTSCGRAICEACAVEVQGKLVCRNCLSAGRATRRKYDPNTAFIIELIGGFFGLLGIGYLYAGKTQDGILRLVIWLIYNVIVWTGILALSAIIIGVVCIPLQLVVQIAAPIWSAYELKKQLLADQEVA